MTIQLHFDYGSERKVIRIMDKNVVFIDLQTNMMSPFEGLEIKDKASIVKEFPDLKDIEDKGKLKTAVAQKFRDKMEELKTERERANWLIKELKQMGGRGLFEQRNGFRNKRIK